LAAKTALGDREGSVVVLDIETGAVLAMWSWPSFDPNIVVDPDYDTAYAYLDELIADERDPLLANAYQQRYMPGSTMKVLTTSVALANQTTSLEQVWPDQSAWLPPQTNDPIENYGGSVCGGDLTEVFRRSCNIPFAQLAVDMGPDAFALGMSAWGVGTPVPIDLPRPAASTIGDDVDDLDDNLPLLAMRGFGQNEVQLVPLHLAMITAAVADNGTMREPYVVDKALDHNGGTLYAGEPTIWREPISPTVANMMVDLMEAVTTSGTASCCIGLNNGISVAAKTGTAQLNGPGGPERSHAWITAFAPVEGPRYAVTVMVKGTNDEISESTGGKLAGPIAKAMLDTAFSRDN
jgi:peptidoglycan glycosyltransferase